MTNQPDLADTAAKADALRALHAGPKMLVLPNAWDAASARIVEAAGFPVIATTSAGVAVALGYEDHQKAPMVEMLAAAKRIIQAVSIPVTVDFEAGYGLSPREVAERMIEIGAAGLNYEDTDHAGASPMVDPNQQSERIVALKDAARTAGADLVVNARVDVFVHRQGTLQEQAAEGLRRAQQYKAAGADCIYPILLSDEAIIREFVEAVGPINVNLRPGGALTLAQVAALGVRRVSYASSLFREMNSALERVTADLHSQTDAL